MEIIIKTFKRIIFYIIRNIIKIYTSLLLILANCKELPLFCYVLFSKMEVFLINNGAIGHYPVNLFLCKQLYKTKSVFVFNSNVEFANEYLNKKIKDNYHFDQRYEKVHQIMQSISYLSLGLYNFNKFPEQMQMGKKLNFGKLFDGESKLFEFSEAEKQKGGKYLDKYRVNYDKYICLLVRNNEYYSKKGMKEREERLRKFLNVDPLGYLSSIEYLVDSGYSVIRMGKGFTEKFPFSHPRFIDYAVSEERNDFLDIWLTAHCKFFLSTSTGIGGLPVVFNKPYIFANSFPYGRMQSWAPKSIHIPRIAQKDGRVLNMKNMVEMDIIGKVDSEYFERIGVEILENESEDILAAVKDMEEKIESGFCVNELNMNFWRNMKNEWHSGIISEFSGNGRRTFDYFHKIEGINTTISDFFLKKYEDIFLDYA